MSADALAYVWRYSPAKNSVLLVHLAIADIVNEDNGWRLWATHQEISRKARVSRSAVAAALKSLERDAFLRRLGGGVEAGSAVQYRFAFKRHVPIVYERRGIQINDMGFQNQETGGQDLDIEALKRTRTEFISPGAAVGHVRALKGALKNGRVKELAREPFEESA